jgi:thiamine transport system ATP-binding protein
MLAIDGITVRYGEHLAVDDVSLRVETGEIVCVLGPSGSGKSTMLRAIAGLEPLAAGRVLHHGADLAGVPPQRRGFGLMFQDHTLFPHRDVLGNVAFGPRMHGATRAAATVRAREVLDVVGLGGFEHRSVAELSGGEQQRVALARALAPAPALLMLDEPLGALDRRLREQLVEDLGALFRELEQSVLFVTHDHEEAFGLADRVAILDRGRIEQVGAPTELWRRPASAFVAGFLGWNVVTLPPGTMHDELGARTAIRADALEVDPDGELCGVVTGRTFRRDHWSVRVDLDAPHPAAPAVAATTTAATVDVAVRDEEPPAPGDRIRLRIDPGGAVPV